MAGLPSTVRPCPTASACADSFSKAPTSRTPMRDGELLESFVLGSNCLMAKEKFETVVATEGSLHPSRPSRPVRSDLGLNPKACRSIWGITPLCTKASPKWRTRRSWGCGRCNNCHSSSGVVGWANVGGWLAGGAATEVETKSTMRHIVPNGCASGGIVVVFCPAAWPVFWICHQPHHDFAGLWPAFAAPWP